ncbi:hypothetical protein OVA26_16605 [Microbacterium sp. SL62]|uniref:hypothetical protein n=1 Tax=Microbacterium sp. SL62 TaxID=2995139 RepID=UPI00227399D9|nr:hypothetical protein [Microbacterium sp. SL62]MCY1718559.1 hypothetical protein [Microbacterium sp. SL62]
MKISPTFYNEDGELLAPRSIDVKRTRALPGGPITIDEGFYHLIKLEGRTARELADARQRFIDTLSTARTGRVVEVREYQVTMDSYVRKGLEIAYVVEPPLAERTRRTAAEIRVAHLAARF